MCVNLNLPMYPLTLLSPLGVHVFVHCLCLYVCFAGKPIYAIFLDVTNIRLIMVNIQLTLLAFSHSVLNSPHSDYCPLSAHLDLPPGT